MKKRRLKTFGSHYCSDAVLSGVWRSGYLYLTNMRLFLFRKKPAQILFETSLDRIRNVSFGASEYLKDKNETMLLLLETDQSNSTPVLLRTEEISLLKGKLEERIRNL